MIERLDLLDKKIIFELNKDVRASFADIAKNVRASKEVVNYRIKRLIDAGIIKEFITNFWLGHCAYKILLQLEKASNETEIIKYLVNHPNINWVTTCSGNWDLSFAIMAKDPEHFDTLLREIFSKIGKHIRNYTMAISVSSETFGPRYILDLKQENEKILKQKKMENPI
ncbi:Lrp/AsnC family transcriptional regulator [archaeon]|nr:Lrp/AsnC family transcriptional regulator [archaeon]